MGIPPSAVPCPTVAGFEHITVVSWDMGHNAVGRPYFHADMLRRRYDSILVGPMFPQFGDGIWKPIRTSDVEMLAFAGGDLPGYVEEAERAIEGLQTDLVIACKPRFPGLLIAMLLKRRHGVPVITDLDEWELSWVGANDALTLDQVERRLRQRNAAVPYGALWSRAAEELIGDADAVTVASPVLRDIYGGAIVPQARDELVFDPARYDREAVRAEYGYTDDDRVVLFLGTPRRFKGVLELAEALEDLGDSRYKLCVIGSLNNPADRIELARVAAGRTQLIEYQPVSEVPRLTLIGDLACLLQDPTHKTTEHQLPAKLTELLAMGVPVLVRATPPLEPLIRDGLISGIGAVPVATRISELFSDRDGMRAQARRGRNYFLDQLSYGATLEVLEGVFAGLHDASRESSPNWERAYELAKRVPWPPGGGHGTAGPASTMAEGGDAGSGAVQIVGTDLIQGRVERLREGAVTGWAWNPTAPGWRVNVRAVVDGQDVAGSVANLDHPSLADDGVGDGHHGFEIRLPVRVASAGDHRLRVETGGVRLAAAPTFEAIPADPPNPWAEVRFSLEDSVIGRVERICDGILSGWACKPDQLNWRPTLRVIVDGVAIAEGLSDLDRPELAGASLGDGRYGFRIPLPSHLASERTHSLRVETTSGVPIPSSPSFETVTEQKRELWEGVEFHVRDAVIGRVDPISNGIVSGWAYRPGAPNWRVWMRVVVDGAEACQGAADVGRAGLTEAGIGDGRHGFRFELPTAVTETGNHRVLVEAEGVALTATAG